jgi:protein O-mannosyl-transferase
VPSVATKHNQQFLPASESRIEASGSPQGSPSSPRTCSWIYAALLIALTVAIYLPVHHYPFSINDDEQYIVNNGHLRPSPSWKTISWAFTTQELANWHPLTWLSHVADYQIFQLNPGGHHDSNLLLHVLNVLALFWVLHRATGFAGRSFVVAALVAVHPVNVESVAWIAERKNLLSLLFFLLALGAYRWYALRPGVRRYAAVASLYLLGLLCKSQIVTLPFVLLLWDWWPLGRFSKQANRSVPGTVGPSAIPVRSATDLVLEKVPLLLLSAGSAFMTMQAQRLAGALRYYPFSFRFENAIVSYVLYLRNALWPTRLVPFYSHQSFAAWSVVASLLLLLIISAWVVRRREQPYLAVGWLWYLGTMVPMIGIVQVGEQAMADRYAYLSFVGLFVAILWGIAEWANQRHDAPARMMVPAAVLLIVMATLTYRQLGYWSSNVTLWTYALQAMPGSVQAEENLGVALLESGRPDEAMEQFERVVASVRGVSGELGREVTGDAVVAHLYLGAYDQQRGRPEAAIDHYQAVLTMANAFASENVYATLPPVLTQMEATALGNMGYAYFALSDLEDAKASFRRALRLNPRGAREWVGLGVIEQKQGNLEQAVRAYAQAAHAEASDINLLLEAQALEQSGQMQEARAARHHAAMVTQDITIAEHKVTKLLTH